MIRLGQKLQKERLERELTIEDVAKATKIKTSFLVAIEKSDYKKLPSGAYASGFVSNYAQFLGFPKRETMALFRREYDEEKTMSVLPASLSSSPSTIPSRLRFGQPLFYMIVVVIALGFFLAFQFRNIIANPPLQTLTPKEGSVVASSPVTVSGTTDPDAVVYINGESTSVDKNGVFTKEVEVFSGQTAIEVKAVSRFGKETEKLIKISYKPSS